MENFADFGGMAVDEVGGGEIFVGIKDSFLGGPVGGVPFGDGQPVAGEFDGGREDFGEFFGAEAGEELGPAVDRAGNSDVVDAELGHFVDALGFQKFDGEIFGSPAGGVEAVELFGFCVVDDGEEVAADAVHHGLDDADGGVGGDDGIDGVAAVGEDLGADLGGEGRFSGDDAAASDDHGASFGAVARLLSGAGGLRLIGLGWERGDGKGEREREQDRGDFGEGGHGVRLLWARVNR